jgi:hypothetical protein
MSDKNMKNQLHIDAFVLQVIIVKKWYYKNWLE